MYFELDSQEKLINTQDFLNVLLTIFFIFTVFGWVPWISI